MQSFFDTDKVKEETSNLMLLVSEELFLAHGEAGVQLSEARGILSSKKIRIECSCLYVFEPNIDITKICLEATARAFSPLIRSHYDQASSVKNIAMFFLKNKYKPFWMSLNEDDEAGQKIKSLIKERNEHVRAWNSAPSGVICREIRRAKN